MKILRISALALLIASGLVSCKKESGNQWEVELKNPG
ncbi:hypothetical protein QE403_000425 [Chryseobacterium sp. SORGH_AS 1048]|nr:hypothetical protein [Chryseobacterium sp. SORGH_AS_1048]